MTNAQDGVPFDLNNDGYIDHLSWTSADSDDSWLALDRDGNGTIDNGHELFGNFTPQPQPPPGQGHNGFLALGVYDGAANGGNGDGVISAQDSIFPSLRLWRDSNHNGLSEPDELLTLQSRGVTKMELAHKFSKKTDQFGNKFGYRSKVWGVGGARIGRWAWDVILLGR